MNGERDEPSPAASPASRVGRATNIPVSVECPLEPRIAEITFDGREIMQPPVSKGEKLYRNACKLDFRKIEINGDTSEEMEVDGEEEPADKEVRPLRTNPDASTVVWGLDGVRNKLRTAYTEISVLHDVLSLAKERKYMRLEPAVNDPMEPRPYFSMAYKKKAVGGVASIFVSAAERLRRSASDAAVVQKSENDYHAAIIKMREQWRLKKQGQTITGDLSYRTVGSSVKGVGQFEVRKNEEDNDKAVDVVITGDLAGESAIQVDLAASDFLDLQRNREDEMKQPEYWSKVIPLDTYWHRRLTSAQNALFCRELFTLMSAEGVSGVDDQFDPIVLSDEIHYANSVGFSMRLKLVHVGEADVKNKSPSAVSSPVQDLEKFPLLTESRILEHSLALMLLSRMREFANPDLPVPACGPVGLKIFRRKMAIQARDRRVWKQGLTGRTLTSELLARATALVLRKRCLKAAESLNCADIQLAVHDCCFTTSWKYIMIKISLTTPGFDLFNRSNCAFNISNGKVLFMTKDMVTPVSCDGELDCRLLYIEVIRQHAVVLQFLLKSNRYDIVHYAPVPHFYNIDENVKSESLRTGLRYAIVITAKSSDNRWLVKLVCSLTFVCRLYIVDLSVKPTCTTVIRDTAFMEHGTDFSEVNLNKIIGGPTRIKRVALVLGCLADLPKGRFPRATVASAPGSHSPLEIPKRKDNAWVNWSAA